MAIASSDFTTSGQMIWLLIAGLLMGDYHQTMCAGRNHLLKQLHNLSRLGGIIIEPSALALLLISVSGVIIPSPSNPCPAMAQVFWLSQLKEAANGFKEFSELSPENYCFACKAVLAEGSRLRSGGKMLSV
ncbi:hypothetical protein OIU85_016629 [Salix viminalis]|uniref:Uncharacterized protein n=1 Tax=Salix viminalis TaxID=40686 RepID=A0A9Q0V6E5_SALVM|nr:hypothetical protein OIU85_016629 [Salix viminalis]